jgi:mono/diheme cytochrome c family protein
MNPITTSLAFWLLVSSVVAVASDAALPGSHPLTQSQAGAVLISELRCGACHAGGAPSSFPEKTAPDLTNVGGRISPDFLKQFLAAPAVAHPGTAMPDLMASKTQAQRDPIANALTHFLVAQSKDVFQSDAPEIADTETGKTLFHTVGCVACHGPRDADAALAKLPKRNEFLDDEEFAEEDETKIEPVQPIAIPIGHVAKKYSVQSLGEFLFQPLHVRSSGRMPDMKLTRDEALLIADYLVGEQQHTAAIVPDADLVAQGEQFFRELNCAACHSVANIQAAAPIGSLQNANLDQGCLSDDSQRSPRFNLDDAQRRAIQASLREPNVADSDALIVAKTLTAFHCTACHARDDFGGVADAYNLFFTADEQNLGDDGRIPPPLTLVGAKLRPEWMKKVLFDGESVRHYMATRMPQYGTANLQHLPEVFSRLDVLEGPEMNLPKSENRNQAENEREKLVRAAGRELIGDKGVNCVACHQFNGKAAMANQGIDLMTSYQRLQPEWFNRYLRDPGAFRPRTVMPTAWPNGVAGFTTILDGDTDQQIAAIWYYLSLGTSAADPSGVHSVSTKLTVGDHAETYRGRSRVAGFRGIAVGLPERLSYAFNAETGTLSAIWQDEFVSVNWSGQGAGDFNPVGPAITLAQDVSFARLAASDTPWPRMPVMTKEAPVNPDPLYPKNLGYQFRGYELDDKFVPTFLYRFGEIAIQDRSVATGTDEQPALSRSLQLDSPVTQTVWFRALTGDIVQESERVFRSGKLRLTIPTTQFNLRRLGDETQQSELLLQWKLPQGKSNLELIYEPIN